MLLTSPVDLPKKKDFVDRQLFSLLAEGIGENLKESLFSKKRWKQAFRQGEYNVEYVFLTIQ